MAHLDASGITRLVIDLKGKFATMVDGAVPIAQGGTGATTAAGAVTNVVDGQALAPASVAATGEVSATSGTTTHNLSEKQDQHSTATCSLTVAGWSGNAQSATATGVTATNTVIVAPAPASAAAWAAAGVLCTAQAAGSLTFSCTTAPTEALTANVLILD